MKKMIAFDLDGTLYYSEKACIPMIKNVLNDFGVEVPDDKFLHSFFGEPGHVFFKWFKSLPFNESFDLVLEKMAEYELEAVQKYGELYDGALELLNFLQEKNYIITLCSNGTERYIKRVLEIFKISRFFSELKYPADKTDTKPRMLKDLKRKFKPEISYMVGDRFHDFYAANEMGFISIAAAYGYGNEEIYKADYVVHSLREIIDLLNNVEVMMV